jgi:CRP-like cAMP-binding protein
MAIATAPVDFETYDRSKTTPLDGPALEALKACAELRSVPLDALRSLAWHGMFWLVGCGVIVAAQGTRLDSAIMVVRGRVRSVCRASNGREISVEVFRPGDLIADFVLASDLPLANDWEAVEASSLLVIPREAFMAFLRTTPDALMAVAAGLCGRLERSKQLATGIALSGVQERVVSRLVALGRQDGPVQPEGLLIRNRPTQQELANQIGACRETVSRTVSELVRQGLLTPRGRSLLVSKRLIEGSA